MKHTKVEGGIFAATNIELFKGFRFLASGMWGPGMGRYLIGMAPQIVVVPVSASGAACSPVAGCDVGISPVHSGDALVGFEAQASKKTLFGFYAGAMYAQRNSVVDITKAGAPAFIGFGGPIRPTPTIAPSRKLHLIGTRLSGRTRNMDQCSWSTSCLTFPAARGLCRLAHPRMPT